jgi:hypothetical protein
MRQHSEQTGVVGDVAFYRLPVEFELNQACLLIKYFVSDYL